LRRFLLLLAISALALVWTGPSSAQILHKKKKVDQSTDNSNTAEPDKQLYDKAMDDIKHGRHEVGRLGLQTLINTYPDSEYLAKAKLAIADSYFKEGGTSNTTQAIAGYKDFIVFFPFLPEAAYAQMQVAMANYNEMSKADRDNTHMLDAESEFQTFLEKYPKDPLAPQAEQRLRDVQELLAEGQYRIAYYYYLKGDRRATAGRLIPLVRRYPLYSKSDSALWMLADVYERSERKDLAGMYYAQIVKNYPLSPKVADARAKLKAFGMPIPQPDPEALEWMQAEQNTPHPKESMLHKPVSLIHSSGPDVRMAATHGLPNLQPEGDDQAGMDTLSGKNAVMTSHTGTAGTGIVATVKAGDAAPAGSGTSATEDAPSSDSTTGNAGATTGTDSNASDPQTKSNATDSNASGATGAAAPSGSPAQSGSGAAATPNGAAASGAASDGSSSTGSTSSDNTQSTSDSSTQNQNSNGKESSSKKKGLKKLLPW
jgi:outer membrane protein assembly factor BamD